MAQEENEEDFPGRLLHQAALWGNAELLEDLLHGEMVRVVYFFVRISINCTFILAIC